MILPMYQIFSNKSSNNFHNDAKMPANLTIVIFFKKKEKEKEKLISGAKLQNDFQNVLIRK